MTEFYELSPQQLKQLDLPESQEPILHYAPISKRFQLVTKYMRVGEGFVYFERFDVTDQLADLLEEYDVPKLIREAQERE